MRKTAKPSKKNIKRAVLDAKKLEQANGGNTTFTQSNYTIKPGTVYYCPPSGNGYNGCGMA